jgi:hypothetical protein
MSLAARWKERTAPPAPGGETLFSIFSQFPQIPCEPNSENSGNIENKTLPPASVLNPTRRKVTASMLARFRTARAWLLPRLPELLAAGWTMPGLFHVGRLAWPYLWGVAWSSAWGDPDITPSLEPDGSIRWTVQERHRVVVQRSRPMEAVCAS